MTKKAKRKKPDVFVMSVKMDKELLIKGAKYAETNGMSLSSWVRNLMIRGMKEQL